MSLHCHDRAVIILILFNIFFLSTEFYYHQSLIIINIIIFIHSFIHSIHSIPFTFTSTQHFSGMELYFYYSWLFNFKYNDVNSFFFFIAWLNSLSYCLFVYYYYSFCRKMRYIQCFMSIYVGLEWVCLYPRKPPTRCRCMWYTTREHVIVPHAETWQPQRLPTQLPVSAVFRFEFENVLLL